jgi:lipoprotein-anchoring transpeptidase ErfK/SrfK
MPHSIFFSGGYAIHATPHTGALGRPASHGCVRLSPGHAATLYGIVKNDIGVTTIRIIN